MLSQLPETTPIRIRLARKYANARFSILVVIAFTIINIVMRVSQSTAYWLFSANIPFFLVDIGMYFGGIYQNPTAGMVEQGFGLFGAPFFYAMLTVAILLVCGYFVCWLLSNGGNYVWMFGALVAFAVDTLFLIAMAVLEFAQGTMTALSADLVIDFLLHAYVVYALVDGILARRRYLTLPDTTTPAQ